MHPLQRHAYWKQYYAANKERLLAYKNAYYRRNCGKINAAKRKKFHCECGSVICSDYIARHYKTDKHKRDTKTGLPYFRRT